MTRTLFAAGIGGPTVRNALRKNRKDTGVEVQGECPSCGPTVFENVRAWPVVRARIGECRGCGSTRIVEETTC